MDQYAQMHHVGNFLNILRIQAGEAHWSAVERLLWFIATHERMNQPEQATIRIYEHKIVCTYPLLLTCYLYVEYTGYISVRVYF